MKKAAAKLLGVTILVGSAKLAACFILVGAGACYMSVRMFFFFSFLLLCGAVSAATDRALDPVWNRLVIMWQAEVGQSFRWCRVKTKKRAARRAVWAAIEKTKKHRLAALAYLVNAHVGKEAASSLFTSITIEDLAAGLGDEPITGLWEFNLTPGVNRDNFWRMLINTLVEEGASAVLTSLSTMPIVTTGGEVLRKLSSESVSLDHFEGKESEGEESDWVVLEIKDKGTGLAADGTVVPHGWHACGDE